jgi:hypothetical protein
MGKQEKMLHRSSYHTRAGDFCSQVRDIFLIDLEDNVFNWVLGILSHLFHNPIEHRRGNVLI